MQPFDWTPATRRIWQAMLAGKHIWIRDPENAFAGLVRLGNQIAAQRLLFAGLAEWVPGLNWTLRRRPGVRDPLTNSQRAEP